MLLLDHGMRDGVTKRDGGAEGVRLAGIAKSFGTMAVLAGLDLVVRAGEFLTLLGPSGCGKSTLLRIIAGLERQDRGTVSIAGRPVDHLPPAERDVAMVFQSYALYPHMTVAGNLATPLEMRRLTLLERLPLIKHLSPRRGRVMRGIMAEVRAVAEALRIETLLDRKPAQLSGGQRQRVALGRAMVRHPAVFLMDEPLSNLDAALRVEVRHELADLHARLGTTFIYVTHDQVEAMTMSSRIALMDQGRILQLGTPEDLYDRPASLAVARFIGSPSLTVLDTVADDGGGIRLGALRLPFGHRFVAGTRLSLGIRPEAFALPLGPQADGPALAAHLVRAENLGAEWHLHVGLDLPQEPSAIVRLTAAEHEAARTSGLLEDPLTLVLRARGVHLFGPDGARVELDRAHAIAVE